LSLTQSFDAESHWPTGMKNVGRLAFLLRKFNKRDRYPALVEAVDETRLRTESSTRPWMLAVLVVDQTRSLVSSASSAHDALCRLAGSPLLQFDLDEMAKPKEGMWFLNLVSRESFHHDGKVVSRQGGTLPYVLPGTLFGISIATQIFMAAFAERFTLGALLEGVGDWPHLTESRRTLIALAVDRFSAGDHLSAGHILLPQFEGLLRDLLRVGAILLL
jgi:hypothetical protein